MMPRGLEEEKDEFERENRTVPFSFCFENEFRIEKVDPLRLICQDQH